MVFPIKKGVSMTSRKLNTGNSISHIQMARFHDSEATNTFALNPGRRFGNQMIWSRSEINQSKFKLDLYRFLRDNIPLLHACIWTWSRLSSAPGKFEITGSDSEKTISAAQDYLDRLSARIYPFRYHKLAGLESFLPFLFSSLYTDGAFCGFLTLTSDGGGVDTFRPVDPAWIGLRVDKSGDEQLVLQTTKGEMKIKGNDFYYFGLNADIGEGLGRSILCAVPFVARIEQQLVDDMQKTMHNSGYHRLHVKITPPEKMSGESDEAFVERINSYFDDTVSMIKRCAPEDNPVTWDNVQIEYVGPRNVRTASSSWSLNHRAMIEEICAGTNLSPFMLGYSYGTTHNWAQFKFDLVMRQVVSVQRQAARFLEWIGNIELALKGLDCRCRYIFDNRLSYQAMDAAGIEQTRVDNLIKLFTAGLIGKDDASRKAGELL